MSFGLVNIPVHLFSGTNPRQGLDLDMLHKDDHAPIRYARICREDGEEVPWDDIVKGYEYREGDYVVLTKADFDKADVHRTKTIDIQQFVHEPEIDIRYFDKPYYLEPGEGAEKAYVLLREALETSGKVALTRFVLHEREHLGVIKPVGQTLILNQLRWPTDLREGTELKIPGNQKVAEAELKIALQLISQQTKPFAAEDYQDTYTDNLEKIIASKTKGKKVSIPKEKPEKTHAKDLMAALKASLDDGKKK